MHQLRTFPVLALIIGLLSSCSGQDPLLTFPSDELSLNQGNNSILSDSQTVQLPSDSLLPPDQANETNFVDLPIPEVSEASIVTSKGPIKVKLYPEIAPHSVQNFLSKAQSNYYQGLIFHRVENWVIQGGDPLGNGTGGGKISTELSDREFTIGSVGMARGSDIRESNDSQFFICVTACTHLTGAYTLFGEVIEGLNVVESIQFGDTIERIEI
jgi:peptidyl-prolyl cis-trans isomerase B (cyclophilin B)